MIFKAVIVFYNLVLTFFLLFQGAQRTGVLGYQILIAFLLPVGIYFTLVLIGKIRGIRKVLAIPGLSLIKGLAFGLSLVTTSILLLFNLLYATASSEYIFAAVIAPLPLYFWGSLVGRSVRGSRKQRPQEKPAEEDEIATAKVQAVRKEEVNDPKRRDFLKKIGGVGLGILAYSILNPREAGAAFFGGVPGPGTVAIKDTTDTKIDPAISSPTDAFGISEIDDGDPAYYGFINKAGYWYILQEDETAGDFSYRYLKGGPNDFPAKWTGRGGWTYEYFNQIFG